MKLIFISSYRILISKHYQIWWMLTLPLGEMFHRSFLKGSEEIFIKILIAELCRIEYIYTYRLKPQFLLWRLTGLFTSTFFVSLRLFPVIVFSCFSNVDPVTAFVKMSDTWSSVHTWYSLLLLIHLGQHAHESNDTARICVLISCDKLDS